MDGLAMEMNVRRLPVLLSGDPRRTIMRFFWPGDEARAERIVQRVCGLDDSHVQRLLAAVRARFGVRHPDFEQVLMGHYEEVCARMNRALTPDNDRRLLLGAYFTMEYAFESAALFNPSMDQAIQQDGVPAGSVRFIMSLRAVGEGHVSSIVFRRGLVDPEGNVSLEPISPWCRSFRSTKGKVLVKETFRRELQEINYLTPTVEFILGKLSETFTYSDLLEAMNRAENGTKTDSLILKTYERMLWLAKSDYNIEIPPGGEFSEAVLFPVSQSGSHGMEDMRLVRLTDIDGSVRYCGVFTAFDGSHVLPQILEHRGGPVIDIYALQGSFARNKGMALFPRRVNGHYMMLARVDGENLYLLWSDDIYVWDHGDLLDTPQNDWEFVQIGNCGSPIETEVGWLVLTHGVGPMRRYSMGAILLDLDDPRKVIGRLDQPLLTPTEGESSGYVPNVVYSCGGMVHNGMLVIPYGISDSMTGFATLPLRELLDHLRG